MARAMQAAMKIMAAWTAWTPVLILLSGLRFSDMVIWERGELAGRSVRGARDERS
jgi:hypothetical protein